MSALDLDAFVTRSRVVADSAPPTTGRETRAWLVDPFLETLGWDRHADSCVSDTTIDGTKLEYVCSVDGIPALFVAVDPFDESLDKSRAVALLETMAWTGIDRAIYTNGRDYLLLAGTTDAERLACRLPSLPDHESAIAHYSREAVARHLERHSRAFVARQLAVDRASLLDSIVATLVDATEQGAAYEAEFEAAASRFLEQLVASFADDGRGQPVAELEDGEASDVSIQFSETDVSGEEGDHVEPWSESPDVGYTDPDEPSESAASESTATARSSETDSSPAAENESRTETDRGGDAPEPTPEDGDVDERSAPTAESEDDDEYVVRFFNDRGSIGAIGHSNADQALFQTAEYLFGQGLSGVTVPWSPNDADGSRAVLNDSPTHADGTPMTAPQPLSNGLYLETGGETTDRAARVEALVARAGLRAMLTGDWETE
ncbi:hypothetical protein [Natronorubrum halophilum]|uniref:hypothetical protein n=1 Tax=Natronorubrum halophilum TaxID=1702106 RepID=UPI000EF6C92A|nr:hypothetical protein [Natronorubrum halophilum]